MRSLKHIITGLLIGGLTWLALGGQTTAQQRAGGAAPPFRSARTSWQQRVLQKSPNKPPSATPTGYRVAQQPTRAQISPEPDYSTGQEASLLDGRTDSEPLPKDTAYDPIAELSTGGHGEFGTSTHIDGHHHHGGGCDCGGCQSGCDDSGGGYEECGGGGCACGGGCDGGYPVETFGGIPKPLWMRNLSLFAGVHGFKGPPDFGRNGNFGMQEGVNWSTPIGGPWPIGFQVGMTGVQSNFMGNQTVQYDVLNRGWDTTTADRDQIFVTAGLFHRANCGGWQGGVAMDFLHDNYYEQGDLSQLRAELGYVMPCAQREIGFWGSFGTAGDRFGLPDQTFVEWEPTDMYAFYYRRYFERGGEGRLWAGFTGQSDALLGAEIRIPVGHSWAIENRANFLLPSERRGTLGQPEESWGLTVQVVWYPGLPAHRADRTPFRPLFGVADNSTFMVDMIGP